MTGVKAHDDAVKVSYGALQVAITGATTQAAINTAYITHYRACLASAKANGCGIEPFVTALKSLGVNA